MRVLQSHIVNSVLVLHVLFSLALLLANLSHLLLGLHHLLQGELTVQLDCSLQFHFPVGMVHSFSQLDLDSLDLLLSHSLLPLPLERLVFL